MIVAHISELELSNLEDSGRAQVTLQPAQDGVVSHALVFERELTRQWTAVADALPPDDTDVLIVNGDGIEVARYFDKDEDSVDQPGHDAGFIGTFAWPGRSWGNSLRSDPRGQPTFWMHLPAYPDLEVEHDAATTRAPAHLPAVDRDALCLSLLTDDQAALTLDRIKESRRLSYVAAIYSGIDHDGGEE